MNSESKIISNFKMSEQYQKLRCLSKTSFCDFQKYYSKHDVYFVCSFTVKYNALEIVKYFFILRKYVQNDAKKMTVITKY